MRPESRSIPFNLLLVAAGALTAAACQANSGGGSATPVARDAVSVPAPASAVALARRNASKPVSASVAAEALPPVLVHKSASCGCCGAWIEHLREAGFTVRVNETEDLNPIKERLGVPHGKGSCHTAEVGGYMVEGHVPAGDIKRLLDERPAAKGLVLPGMPLGSPGMEVPDGTVQPYTVELVAPDGKTVPYAHHGT